MYGIEIFMLQITVTESHCVLVSASSVCVLRVSSWFVWFQHESPCCQVALCQGSIMQPKEMVMPPVNFDVNMTDVEDFYSQYFAAKSIKYVPFNHADV